MNYIVTARRWERGWELHIADAVGAEIGVTQSRNLAGADRMVRDYLSADGHDTEAVIQVRPELGEEDARRVQMAQRMTAAAEAAQREAAAVIRAVVRDLASSGLSGPDIAKVFNLSTQRVSQLVNSPK